MKTLNWVRVGMVWVLSLPLISLAASNEYIFMEEIQRPQKIKNPFSFLSLKGDVTFMTEDMFRGISQTDGRPAYQGDLTFSVKEIGIYANLLGSNTRALSIHEDDVERATFEIDATLGINRTLTDKLSYDLSLVRYAYPEAPVLAYNETIATLTYDFLTALIGYSSRVFGSDQSGTYYNLSAEFDLPKQDPLLGGLTISGGVGHYHLPPVVGKSYQDYSVSVTKKLRENVKVSLTWTDTNHKLYHNRLDRGQIVAILTVSF